MTVTESAPRVSFDLGAAVSPELRTRIAEVNALFAPFVAGLEEKCEQAYEIKRLVEQAIEAAVDAVEWPDGVDVQKMQNHLFEMLEEMSGLNALTGNLASIQVLTGLPDWRVVDALRDADTDQEDAR